MLCCGSAHFYAALAPALAHSQVSSKPTKKYCETVNSQSGVEDIF
jgi:hypothetical protein